MEDKVMRDLRRTKRKISKLISNMTWPEMKQWLDEEKKKRDEDKQKFREGKEKQKV